MGTLTGPSLIRTLLGACGLRSLRVALSPCFRFGLAAPHTPVGAPGGQPGGEGDWSSCCRRIPQSAPEGLFLFEKILLLNPATPSLQGRACPLTQPTSLARPRTVWVRAPHGPTLNSPQLAPTVSLCLPHFILLPLPATSSNQVSLGTAQALFGRRGNHQLGSLPGVLRQAWWVRAWGCSRPGPHSGPRDLFVLKQSPYRLFFQCPLYFLVSYLHKRWGAVSCLLCSSVDELARCFTCVPRKVDSAPTYLSTILSL